MDMRNESQESLTGRNEVTVPRPGERLIAGGVTRIAAWNHYLIQATSKMSTTSNGTFTFRQQSSRQKSSGRFADAHENEANGFSVVTRPAQQQRQPALESLLRGMTRA